MLLTFHIGVRLLAQLLRLRGCCEQRVGALRAHRVRRLGRSGSCSSGRCSHLLLLLLHAAGCSCGRSRRLVHALALEVRHGVLQIMLE